ncbi:MAG TPA: oligosaccharide flippase family protein [Gemmatimonadales bacterium]|nr:oligosaccharide flippase family protein [Gemmatimonadales bacterium]
MGINTMPAVSSAAPVQSATPKGAALTRRASLTAVASLLDYTVKAGVLLVITPILVSTLGRSLYGMWEMLGRLIGYMAAADGRPTDALRLVISQQQNADVTANRRAVGAALAAWVIMLPLVALVGGALVWFSPALTHAPAAQYGPVRLTCALLVLAFVFTGLATIPESVLRGMNLGYKRMGLQSGLSIVAGGLAVWAVTAGWGLPGMGFSQIARASIAGVLFWLLVRKYVPWFRVAKPTRAGVKGLFSMSVWLAFGDLVSKLLLASDVLILGWVISPAAVTTYVLTSYAARTGLGVFVFTAGAAMPGFGGVLGQLQFTRAAQLRRELQTLTWLFTTIVGATVLIWNHSFLHLWVGGRNYAGPWVDLMIVLVISQTAFIRTDSYIIDAALRPRGRVVIGAVTVVATLALGITLTHLFGIVGLCAGLFLGRSIQSISYPLIVRNCLHHPPKDRAARWSAIRLVAVTVLLFGAASYLSRDFRAGSWPMWVAGVVLTVPVVAALALALGPTAETRKTLITRIRAMLGGLKPKAGV